MGRFLAITATCFLAVLTFGVMQDDSNSAAGFSVTERRATPAIPVTTRRVIADADAIKSIERVKTDDGHHDATKVKFNDGSEHLIVELDPTPRKATESELSGIDLIKSEVAAGPVARIVQKVRERKPCCMDCACTDCNCSYPGECLVKWASKYPASRPGNHAVEVTHCHGDHCDTRIYKPPGTIAGFWRLNRSDDAPRWWTKWKFQAVETQTVQGTAPAYYAQPQQFFQPTYSRGFRGGCSSCR